MCLTKIECRGISSTLKIIENSWSEKVLSICQRSNLRLTVYQTSSIVSLIKILFVFPFFVITEPFIVPMFLQFLLLQFLSLRLKTREEGFHHSRNEKYFCLGFDRSSCHKIVSEIFNPRSLEFIDVTINHLFNYECLNNFHCDAKSLRVSKILKSHQKNLSF